MESTAPTLHNDGSTITVTFGSYSLASYGLFLKCKQLPESQIAYDWQADRYTITTPARFARILEVEETTPAGQDLPLAPHLFDYQRFIVERALTAKRFAVWADTGLGKTAVYLEWSRQVMGRTGAKVLILCPLQIIEQAREMAAVWYGDDLPIERLESREQLAAWCKEPGAALGICNYEKLIAGVMPELRYLGGLVADESSILKSGGGVIKWNLIKSARGIEYKLSCTATPAPNDTMEYASQASFLEKLRSEGEILWTYFTRDKAGNWKVKPHAREAFYRFMSSWSIYMRNPAVFGFGDILASLPDPEIREYELGITDAQRDSMYGILHHSGKGLFTDERMGVTERSKLSQIAKGFLYHGGRAGKVENIQSVKPRFVAELAKQDVREGRQVLIWTVFDEESRIIAAELAAERWGVGVLDGDMAVPYRLAMLNEFRSGVRRVLISKAQLLGYGLNLQFCRSMIFSGFDDSFERMYQAVRRCYRFGQTEAVRVHIPYVPALEGMIFGNVKAKEAAFLRDVDIQERYYREALRGELP